MRWSLSPGALEVRWYVGRVFPGRRLKHMPGRNERRMRAKLCAGSTADALLKVLIVDDAPLARSALIELCEWSNDVQVVGEAASGGAAIEAAEKLRPDVMLLDVELPDMSGFEVLRLARSERRPLGIIVTAHTDYAVSAYEAGALDYLVKPVTADRFAQSLERARQYCNRKIVCDASTRSWPDAQPAQETGGLPGTLAKLIIGEREHRFYPLNPESIDYIESDGNYVTIRAGNSKYISRDSIKRLSVELADLGFVRIERSLLVNIRAVVHLEAVGRGAFAITLSSGSSLHSSPSYRDAILRVLPMRRLPAQRRNTRCDEPISLQAHRRNRAAPIRY
jgi:two-component system, LytTR family, response regulator